MRRTSRLFHVKTYDSSIKSELGGIGLYYAFGYQSEWTGYRIMVFNPETFAYRIMTDDNARDFLEYYFDDPIDIEIENNIMSEFKIKTGL